jgi:hypothetical protein
VTIEDATLAIDYSSGLHVELPETGAFLSAGLSKAGTSVAIKQAEGRGGVRRGWEGQPEQGGPNATSVASCRLVAS